MLVLRRGSDGRIDHKVAVMFQALIHTCYSRSGVSIVSCSFLAHFYSAIPREPLTHNTKSRHLSCADQRNSRNNWKGIFAQICFFSPRIVKDLHSTKLLQVLDIKTNASAMRVKLAGDN